MIYIYITLTLKYTDFELSECVSSWNVVTKCSYFHIEIYARGCFFSVLLNRGGLLKGRLNRSWGLNRGNTIYYFIKKSWYKFSVSIWLLCRVKLLRR